MVAIEKAAHITQWLLKKGSVIEILTTKDEKQLYAANKIQIITKN